MKKETQKKKWTKKIKERGERVKNNSYGITLIALVITIALNCSYLAMERMLKKELILKII